MGRPVPHRQFDGKIHLERVSKKRYIQKCTAHTNFCDDALINSEITTGEWKKLVVSDLQLNVRELKQLIFENYDLDMAVLDRLEFQYQSKIGRNGNEKTMIIKDDEHVINMIQRRVQNDPDLPKVSIAIEDIILKVRMKLGDEVEEDASCDSAFMLIAMRRVGAAIRRAYHWMPMHLIIFLVMDNAGGHGTNAAIDEYTQMLKEEYNIEIIFQIPRSPYCNVLDLGVWMALQAVVERQHYLQRCSADALVNTVMRSWNDGNVDHAITKVF